MWKRVQFSQSHVSSFLVENGVARGTLSVDTLLAVLGFSEDDYYRFPSGFSFNLQLVKVWGQSDS